MRNLSRRYFIPGVAASFVLRASAPSDKLNIATVGIGGMGGVYTKNCESENIVAVCDVDDVYAAPAFKRYPNAKRYKDYRKMLETEKGIDAVIIGTPDHTHAAVAMAAMKLGKAVYCAKPMTRTIHEARTLAKTAREMKVATQMSVQSCASDAACTTAEWIQARRRGHGARGTHLVRPPGVAAGAAASGKQAVACPGSLDWDLWLGPAPVRPYHPRLPSIRVARVVRFRHRRARRYGVPCVSRSLPRAQPRPAFEREREHQLHRAVVARKGGRGMGAEADAGEVRRDVPDVVRCHLGFSVTDPGSSGMTAESSRRAPRNSHPGSSSGARAPCTWATRASCSADSRAGRSSFRSRRRARGRRRRKPSSAPRGHYEEWIAAAKGGKPANCNFDFGALLTETALLGVIAQRTGKHLVWDAEAARFTNEPDANRYVQEPYRAGWSL